MPGPTHRQQGQPAATLPKFSPIGNAAGPNTGAPDYPTTSRGSIARLRSAARLPDYNCQTTARLLSIGQIIIVMKIIINNNNDNNNNNKKKKKKKGDHDDNLAGG